MVERHFRKRKKGEPSRVTANKTCRCNTCKKDFHYLGIARHRSWHTRRGESCSITYTYGNTEEHIIKKNPVIETETIKKVRMFTSKEMLNVGKAAEHLVVFDLLMNGHQAYLSDQGLPYDVIVDLNGKLLRIQVKSSLKTKNANADGRCPNNLYLFHIRRRGKLGKGNRLSEKDCDLVALVALDIKTIAYVKIKECGQTLGLFPPGYAFEGKHRRNRHEAINELPFEKAAKEWLRK